MIKLCYVDDSHHAVQFYFLCDPSSNSNDTFAVITADDTTFDYVDAYSSSDGRLDADYKEMLKKLQKEHCFYLTHSTILKTHFIAIHLKMHDTIKRMESEAAVETDVANLNEEVDKIKIE